MSNIQAAARAFVEKAEKGCYTDEDVKQLIEAVKECDSDPYGKKAMYRAIAKKHYTSEGDLEFDEGNVVSLGDDEGAYVQCWKWIPQPK
jgi:hypothetical protein